MLPLLGAVPDGAIILFSGLGDIEEAQETLSVGVGALAGSTIMLLTVPWALSIFAGRVDIDEAGKPGYMSKPKLTDDDKGWNETFEKTGVSLTESVQHGGIIMAITTAPYFLIQIPAMFMHGPTEQIADGEHWWALSGLVICLIGLMYYMRLQLHFSQEGQDKDKRVAVIKKALAKGEVSLSGALATEFHKDQGSSIANGSVSYQTLAAQDPSKFVQPPPDVASYLKDILVDSFKAYDKDRSGELSRSEIRMFFKDFHEHLSEREVDRMFEKSDRDGDGTVSFEE